MSTTPQSSFEIDSEGEEATNEAFFEETPTKLLKDTWGCLDLDEDGFLCSNMAAFDDTKEPRHDSAKDENNSGELKRPEKDNDRVVRQPAPKKRPWTPVEDAVICALYNSKGPKWTLIAKLLPGRNANAVKYRYQNIGRKMEKMLSVAPSLTEGTGITTLGGGETHLQLVAAAANCILALRSQELTPPAWQFRYDYEFGPYGAPVEGALCERCNLLVPSDQTGRVVCIKTKWCRPCTEVPPFVSGNLLRKIHKESAKHGAVRCAPGKK